MSHQPVASVNSSRLNRAARLGSGIRTNSLRNEATGARTLDLRIKSPLLYQLSYGFAGRSLERMPGLGEGLAALLPLGC